MKEPEKYHLDELMDLYESQELRNIAFAAKKLDYSTNSRDAADQILSGRKITISDLTWCIDSLTLFANNVRDKLKYLKKVAKETVKDAKT